MGSGHGSWVNALRPLLRARVYSDLLGLLQRVRAFFLRVSFVRRGISVAAGGTSGRDFGTRAQHCVGARHLLCSSHSFELEIRLHYPHRFLSHDHDVFDCCGMAFSEEASLKPLIARVLNSISFGWHWPKSFRDFWASSVVVISTSGSTRRVALTTTGRYQNTIDAMRRSGASSCPRKASQERVHFILEFFYGKNLQRPKYRRISAQAADAGGRSDSSCARNRDVRQFYSRRNGRRRPL